MPEPAGQVHGSGNTAMSALPQPAAPSVPATTSSAPLEAPNKLLTLEHPSMQMLLGLPLICSVLLLHL